MSEYKWIQDSVYHPWSLGCRTCQLDAERDRDRNQRLLEAIFTAADVHPMALYEAIEDAKNSLKN